MTHRKKYRISIHSALLGLLIVAGTSWAQGNTCEFFFRSVAHRLATGEKIAINHQCQGLAPEGYQTGYDPESRQYIVVRAGAEDFLATNCDVDLAVVGRHVELVSASSTPSADEKLWRSHKCVVPVGTLGVIREVHPTTIEVSFVGCPNRRDYFFHFMKAKLGSMGVTSPDNDSPLYWGQAPIVYNYGPPFYLKAAQSHCHNSDGLTDKKEE